MPGNHDLPLVREYVRAPGRDLHVDSEVPLTASRALTRVASWLAPARVTVHYPGVWLADGVYATHGHYLDRHLMPESAIGIWRGLFGRLPRDGARPIDYERTRRPSLVRTAGRLPRPAATLLEQVAEVVRAATMPRVRRGLVSRRFAPLIALLLGLQMRRASIPALIHVVTQLGIDAEVVVFGHVHRLGPLPGEDLGVWHGPNGRPRVLNSGAWVYERVLVDRVTPPHPYWPGGAVLLEPGAPPRAVGLLDGLSVAQLQ